MVKELSSPALRTFLSILPCLLVQVLYLSPLFSVREILKKKSTKDKSPMPFIGILNNGAIWSLYGFLVADLTVAIPNITGAILGIFGTAVFSKYCRMDVRPYIAAAAAINVTAVVIATTVPNPPAPAAIVGYLGCAVTVILFASPLATIVHVVRTKDTSSMPFPMSVAVVCNALSWVVYGVLVAEDILIYIPNAIGLALGIAQLFVYARYRRYSRERNSLVTTCCGDRDCSPHHHLVTSASSEGGYLKKPTRGQGESDEMENDGRAPSPILSRPGVDYVPLA